MKRLAVEILMLLITTTMVLAFANIVHAQDDALIELEGILGGQEKSGLSKFEDRKHKLSSVEPGAEIITSVIFTAIDFLKYLIGSIAVLYVIVSGIKLIAAGKKIDEISEKQKENLKFIIYGLIMIITADELVTKVFFGDYGECIGSATNAAECAKVGGSLIKGIYSLVLAALGTLAIFILVLSAFRMVTAYGNEETINKQKKRILMSIVGILVAGVGEFAIKGIIFREGGTQGIDVTGAQKLVTNFTNFIAAFIGAGAFAMLFYGGYMYVASFGNEEKTAKAKKIIIGAIIGILIALAAFGVITSITTLSPGREIGVPGKVPGLPGGGK